jgi:hypothetical protein
MSFAFCALLIGGRKRLFKGVEFSHPWHGVVFIVSYVCVLWAGLLYGVLGPVLISLFAQLERAWGEHPR